MESKRNKLVFYGVKYFPSRGGTSRVAEALIHNLANQFDVTIYCYKNPKASKHINNVKTIQFRERIGNLGVLWYYFVSAIHLIINHSRETVIHAHKTDCALFLPMLKLKFKRIIATSHEAPYHRDKWGTLGKRYFQFMEWVFIHSGVTLTSISKPLADYYESRYNKKVIFIPNGINTNLTVDTASAKELLVKHEINEPYFLFSARRIMSTKGLHTMLAALDVLNTTTPIVIAGDANHAKKYVKKLKQKFSHLNIIFTGYVELPVLLGLIRESKLFIFPSEIEGMSIMLLEVVSLGVHIICSDIPENTQVFTDEEILFFENKNSKDLAEKIAFALDNPSKMNDFAKTSKQKIKTQLNWEHITQSYKDLYIQR